MKVSPDIENLVPYKPGKPIAETQREFGLKKVVKLASNENPLGPSPLVVTALEKAAQEIHRYPDPSFYELITRLSAGLGLDRANLSIGNGSNEIIDLLIRIYCEPGDEIATTEAAFLAYAICAQAARVHTLKVPLTPDFRMDLAALSKRLSSAEGKKVRLVFIPNPNNPTGTIVYQDEIESFLNQWGNKQNLLIVFDEAYTEFVRHPRYRSGIHYLSKYSNVLVIRTFSKAFGLAGLRIGFLAADEKVISYFNRVRNPFNVNSLAQVAAIAALEDEKYVQESVKLTWQGLDYFYSELRQMGLSFIESQANFVMFDLKTEAQAVYQALLQRGVILRPVANYGFPHHLRMSVGLEDENVFAIEALRSVLG